MAEFKAVILGIPHIPTIREVNVRSGPSTTEALVFKTPLEVECKVRQVMPDRVGAGRDGKTYQWLELEFPDRRAGWVRDDLVDVLGDGADFGYGRVSTRTLAFKLARQAVVAGSPAEPRPVSTVEVERRPVEPAREPVVTPGGPFGICRARNGANLRNGPGTNHPVIGRMTFNGRGTVIGSAPDQSGTRLKWVNVEIDGLRAFIREDLLRYDGDVSGHGLGSADLYPSPMPDSWWVRDYNVNPVQVALGGEHWGWDLGAETGAAIHAGPKGGVVVKIHPCTRCTLTAPNTLSQGLRIGDPGVLTDPAWGFGYGNFVIVRYQHDLLPESTRDRLRVRGLEGAHLYVLYGHLLDYSANEQQALGPNKQFARCGNTGNSEATHLHLEVRAGRGMNDSWSSLRAQLLDPAVLFAR
jgi:hypothetical protein